MEYENRIKPYLDPASKDCTVDLLSPAVARALAATINDLCEAPENKWTAEDRIDEGLKRAFEDGRETAIRLMKIAQDQSEGEVFGL